RAPHAAASRTRRTERRHPTARDRPGRCSPDPARCWCSSVLLLSLNRPVPARSAKRISRRPARQPRELCIVVTMRSGGVSRAAVVVLLLGLTVCAAPAAARAADPPDPGSTQTFTYGSGLTQYSYIVYVPTTYDAARPAPLVVMTHGCQTT